MFRVGLGYDVHKFTLNRLLILGGVKIPYDFGLAGHSDADVLIHAIMDAILGALGKGDIGSFFPDNDEKYKDINSMLLLEKVYTMMLEEGYSLGNLDSVIIAQTPKMASYIDFMKENIATALGAKKDQVAVKATTTEGLGFTGRKEGIAAAAIVNLVKEN